jgi:3-(methylthio)propanoyl-CoA dehydrogenase
MADYVAPVRDIRFALDLVGLDDLFKYPAFAHVDAGSVDDLLTEYGRFSAEVFAPINRGGDKEHSVVLPGTAEVRTPTGFRDAYQQYVSAGWGSVPFDPAHGGGGFPWLVAIAMQEMLTSSNMAFSLCPLLTQGAIEALSHHGSEELQEIYLRKMVSGEWTGTMNLTEPQAGSDVGALTSKALPAADGTWRVFGQKIYITYGEHDMADNIVHLVLARIPDAPAGTKGISLFIVPKFLVNADGSLGARNDAKVVSLEHKMGINASPTCVMAYGDDGDGAVGFMVGEPNTGMRSMFTMMNNARLSVGLEGLAIAERAYQDAVQYALERVQGRPVGGAVGDAIVGHPDVRRTLLYMRSHIEAMRGLTFMNAKALDMSRHHPDADERAHALELADLLVPLSKAWCTDLGVELTSMAVQIFGGMGFVEETGVAQHYRDARIAPIYEGTNGIQALDLIGRKLPMRGGAVVLDLLDDIEATDARLGAAVGEVRRATTWILGHAAAPIESMAGATPYLRALATTVGGWMLARQAQAAVGDDAYSAAKRSTATFYFDNILPTVSGLCAQAMAGSHALMSVPAEALRSQ